MRKIFSSNRKLIFITSGWWLFWLLSHLLALHRIGLSWSFAFAEGLLTVFVLALAGFVIANTFRYYSPVSKNYWLLAGYIIIITAITGRTLFWSFGLMHASDANYQIQFMPFMPLRGMFYFLMITFLTSFYYFRNKMGEEGDITKREKEALILVRDAELANLRQQLQPHFLFNSLNSISALAGSRPEEARNMIQQLSDFLRGTLRKDDQQLVPLEDEFKHLQLYLEIEKVRFGHRLKTEISHDEFSGRLSIPSLLLQPIVENAVKFGLYDTTEAITIRIKARKDQQYLIVETENPFDPETARPAKGTGFGLTSVQRRLYLLYARNDLLETIREGNTFITKLKIPQT